MFTSLQYRSIVHPEELIDQAMIHFSKIEDPVLECEFIIIPLSDSLLTLGVAQFYNTVGYYYFLYQQNNMSTAMQFLDKALALSRACGDQKWQAIALINIANIEWNMGHYPKGRMCAREAQQLSQLCADSYTEARSLHVEGMCCIGMSDYKTGILLYQRARKHLELCGMSGHNLDHAIMSSMAQVHLLKSEYAEAYSIRSQIAQNTFADQDANQNAWALLNLAEIDIIVGATESEVKQNLDKVRTRLDGSEYSHRLHFYQEFLGVVNFREKGAPTAKTTLQRGFNSNWKTDTDAALMCLEKLAEVCRWTAEDFNWASKWTVICIIYAKKLHSRLALYKALQFMGDVFLFYGDQDTAQNLFTVGLEGLTFMDIHHNRAQCMLRLGDISQQRGNLMQAVEFWEEARPLFEKSSQQQDVLEIDTRLASVNREILDAPAKTVAKLRHLAVPVTRLQGRSNKIEQI
jgi:tetratricopeptide (TPR) repeat protein